MCTTSSYQLFQLFLSFRVQHCSSSCKCVFTPITPTIQRKDPTKKKKVLPRSAAGHSVCVTMVIFNNATSSQSQPQLSRALSQLQKPHTNEGYGKNRSGEAEVGQDDSPTTDHMQNTHRGALTNTNTILSFDKGES